MHPKTDRNVRIYKAWVTGKYHTYEAIGNIFHISTQRAFQIIKAMERKDANAKTV